MEKKKKQTLLHMHHLSLCVILFAELLSQILDLLLFSHTSGYIAKTKWTQCHYHSQQN
jgi:hypothetical protein